MIQLGDPILHHHDPSPFAEKIRLAFGIKRLRWGSVQIPMTMPKPDLLALTGGYRGTPVLQIGADIYCDTRLIIAEIDRRWPEPALLRSGPLVNFAMQHWSDDALFPPGSALAMHEGAAVMPKELLTERALYFTNLDFARFAQDAAWFRDQIVAHAALIERQLADGRAYLLGDQPEWADIGAYFPLWMLSGHAPGAAALVDPLTRIAAWRARLGACGTGERVEIDAAAALAVAQAASPGAAAEGVRVTVWPVAHPETAVAGRLASAGADEIVIHRDDDRAGTVAVHFPAIGYRMAAV